MLWLGVMTEPGLGVVFDKCPRLPAAAITIYERFLYVEQSGTAPEEAGYRSLRRWRLRAPGFMRIMGAAME